MLKEFKTFISRGNVVDLAVGIIIGGAFGKIVASFVADIVMPSVGLLLNDVDFKDLKYQIGGTAEAPVFITYGQFIQNVVDFLIVAFVIFLFVRTINRMKKKKEEAPKPAPEPSKEEILLTEIRDLLKNK